MCGITGQWRLDGRPVDPISLKRMNEAIAHRGPDDDGFVLFDEDSLTPVPVYSSDRMRPSRSFVAGFGHRRLSILDLSAKGHQPMPSSDGTLWITYNGEIYNYIEIRKELEEHGFQFSSGTDTEVILYAYQKWGVDCLARFNGMFAFALFDCRKRELFCARDRFGIKPFYYFSNGDCLVFASEIKSILESGLVEAAPFYPAIGALLKYHVTDYGSETFFRDIHQIPPHHYMIISSRGIVTQSYWDIDPANQYEDVTSLPAERFYHHLLSSIQLRLRSDVQVATCLSGGMDSSSIVCIANRELNQGLKAFSVVYEGEMPISEKRYIDRVLEYSETDGFFTQPNSQDVADILKKLIWHLDTPVTSIGAVTSQYFVMKLINESGIKVVLDGQGADEILGGYHTYFPFHLLSLLKQGQLMSFASNLRFLNRNSTWRTSTKSMIKKALIHILKPSAGTINQYSDKILLTDEFARDNEEEIDSLVFSKNTKRFKNLLHDVLYQETLRVSLPMLLRYEDRMAMAHSVEARVPFLDFNLVEFIFSLPSEYKIRNGRTKLVLRESMMGRVPDDVIQRNDKMGYCNPESFWLRGPWAKMVEEVLLSGRAVKRGIWKEDAVRRIIESHNRNLGDHNVNLSELLSLEIWFRTFLDNA